MPNNEGEERPKPGEGRAKMNAPWHFQLLGRLCASRGDHVVTRFASSRVSALLARLALFPRRDHPREELIELLWPGSDSDAGRLNLRVALASLRRQLEPPDVPPGSILFADRHILRLHSPACRCDAVDFEEALKDAAHAAGPAKRRAALDWAISLFSGELLPGLYDEWVLEERERLNALYENALQQRDALPESTLLAEASLSEASLSETTAFPAIETARQEPPAPAVAGFPLQFTRFFGRAEETAEIAGLLPDPQIRLVTLTGPGGSGKTRLAVEAVRQAQALFSGPLCFVPLADLSDAQFILDAVARSLSLAPSPSEPVQEQIAAHLLKLPPALLVLDNFEHLVETGAPLLFSLLSRLPALTCLVTSRRRLALPGERELPVPPLPLPAKNLNGDEAASFVAQIPSVQLFADRAQAARPDFQITAGNAAAVAALCRTLEGIPLALELAAARTPALTPAQINERLTKRFDVLTSRRGDKGGRHRSLWAALAWSYDLLSPEMQRFFDGLSVFRGGFTVDAAEAVCEEPRALDYLTQLRERSLLTIEETPDEMRFRLLETLREFGGEQLSADDGAALAWRHADWYVALAREAWPQITGPDQARWLDRLEADHDNLRQALGFWLAADAADDHATEAALEICGSIWRFWYTRGHYRSGLEWMRQALARPGGLPYTRARVANAAGNLAKDQSDYSAAEAFYGEALEIMRGLGLKTSIGACLCNLSMVVMHREDYALAQAMQAEALALRREAGDMPGVAFTLSCQGETAHRQKDYAEARRLYGECLELWEQFDDDSGRMATLPNLAVLAWEEGDRDTSIALTARALALCVKLGNRHALHSLLAHFAVLAADRGKARHAATLQAASEAIRERIGVGLSAPEKADREAQRAEVRAQLSAADYAAAWTEGETLTDAQAIALCK